MKSTCRLFALLVLACLCVGCKAQNAEYHTRHDVRLHQFFPAVADSSSMVYHKGFALSYNEATEQASWVGYMLTRDRVNGQHPRRGKFRSDAAVATGSADYFDYKNSGFSRGHLAPAGDMKWDPVAMDESFLFSNMSPQEESFNNGLWNHIENKVRAWANRFDTLFVFTGPVFTPDDTLAIGNNRVGVPSAYYKVVFCPAMGKAIALIVPHRQAKAPWHSFATTVDAVEAATGIDFLHGITNEEAIERDLCIECWNLH